MCSVTLYVIETLLIKEDGVIGLEEVMEGCAVFGQMIGFVLWNLGIDCNWMSRGNVCRIKGHCCLVI